MSLLRAVTTQMLSALCRVKRTEIFQTELQVFELSVIPHLEVSMEYMSELRSLLIAVTKHKGSRIALADHLSQPAAACMQQQVITGVKAVNLLLQKNMPLEASNMASVVLSSLESHY